MTEPANQDAAFYLHKAMMDAIGIAGMMLETYAADMRRFLEQYEFHTGAGAVLDPATFLQLTDPRNRRNVEQQVELVRAALAFLDTRDRLRAEHLHTAAEKGPT